MNIQDPAFQKELLSKMAPFADKVYIDHLGWEDCAPNRRFCDNFSEEFAKAMEGGIAFLLRKEEKSFFEKLPKAHFELLKEDESLTKDEWEQIAERFEVVESNRPAAIEAFKLIYREVPPSGGMEY